MNKNRIPHNFCGYAADMQDTFNYYNHILFTSEFGFLWYDNYNTFSK